MLALDQRSHGETAWATDYAWERWVEDVEALVEALGLRRLSLLGNSMGGWVAWMYTARHPETVERLIIEDYHPPDEEQAAAPSRGYIGIQEDFADPDEYVRTYLRPLYPDEVASELLHYARHGLMQRADGRWVRCWDMALRRADTAFRLPPPAASWAALGSIRCPTLVLKAALRPWPPDIADAMVRALPHGQLVEMPNTRHAMHWTDPAAFAAAVRAFLQEAAA